MNSAFDLKSARLRVEALTVRLNTAQLDEINALLAEKSEQYQMFASMPFILDASLLKPSEQLDVAAVVAAFAAHQLHVVALRNDEHDWSDTAKKAGLIWLSSADKHDTAHMETDVADLPHDEQAKKQPETAETNEESVAEETVENTDEKQPENAESDDKTSSEESTENAETVEPELELTARPTMVINHPVRTGQQIYAQKSDLLVLGMVSEGAELIADGNIYVYAPMRGRALAGESGDKNARIFIQSMQAELVSIAGVYRVFEQNLPPHLHKHAVCVELQEDDRLAISAINAV